MKKISICGIPHTIEEKEDVFDMDTHFGMIDYTKCRILINKDLPPALASEALCHEVVHGILVHIGRDDLTSDETFVQSLGNAISQSFIPKVEEEAIKTAQARRKKK